MSIPRAFPALAACAALAWLAPAAAADAPFTTAPDVRFEPGAKVTSVAIGDFNADGNQDFAAADRTGRRVHVRLGGGDGTFTTAPTISGPAGPNTVVVADFDADGRDDLAVGGTASVAGKGVMVLRGQGTGEFAKATEFDVPDGFARSLATGDFDGDGRTDLAAAAYRHVSVRLGEANLTFKAGTDTAFPALGSAPEPEVLATGDVDGNGTTDLLTTVAIASTVSERLYVLPGLGNGGFGAHRAVSVPSPALGLAVGDLNADAKLDAVTSGGATDVAGVRLGDGAGALLAGAPDVAVGDRPGAVAIGDFDGDGREDVAVANIEGDSVSLRLGDGAGRFEDGGEVPTGDEPFALAAGDLDGDGRADLLVGNHEDGTVSVRLGAGEAPLAGNLLVNGGFEQGPGARDPDSVVAIPGWTTAGGMTAIRYGTPPQIGFLSRLDAPRFQTGGQNFLWAGKNPGTRATALAAQTVDVSRSSAAIDGGRATVRLAAWMGGTQHYPDEMAVVAEFVSAGDASLGVLRLPSAGKDARRGLTTLLRRTSTAAVPAGTRSINVRVTSEHDDAYSSAMADNVQLILDAPPATEPEPGGQPGPGGTPTPQGGGGPDGGPGGAAGPGGRPAADRDAPRIGRARLTRARFAPGRRGTSVRFSLSEPATITLRVERKRGRRAGALRRAGRPGGNRIAFSGRIAKRALRPGAYRLLITAVDAAGNRSVAKPLGFRIVR